MRVIGLIGGMSWTSTLEYYRLINEMVANRMGGLHSSRLVLYSLDFEEIERCQREGRWDIATIILQNAATALKQAGADFLIICANTMHKIAAPVAEKSGLPLLHIGDAVGDAAKKAGMDRMGLLGTRFVMKEDFYRDRLSKGFGIDVLVPREEEQAIVNRIIYEELCREKIEDTSRQACIRIIDALAQRGAQGIILGCTELLLLIRAGDVSMPVLDTTQLHAQAAVELALAE